MDAAIGRVLSRPVRVRWAGWQTNTLDLQQNGWQLAVDFDHHRSRYKLCLTHRALQLWALSDWAGVPPVYADANYFSDERYEFNVVHIGKSINIQVHENSPLSFCEIDATPVFSTKAITRLEDLNIFSAPKTRTEEILVSRADMSVVEHLEAIKALQSGKQKELRRKMAESRDGKEFAPSMTMVAQLIEYGEAA